MSQATVKIPPLSKDNYDTWKIHAKALLVKNGVWAYVCGKKKRPTNEAESIAWSEADEIAMSDIILTIGANQLKHVSGCNTSFDMWNKLKNMYESEGPTRKAMLLEELIHHKMEETQDMRDHVSKFFDTVNKLESMDINIPQEMIVILLLSSIPKSYEPLRIAIKSRKELPTPEELKIKLLDEYQARKRSTDIENSEAMLVWKQRKGNIEKKKEKPFQSKTDGQFKCYRCGKPGHFAKTCRSKLPENKFETSKRAEVTMRAVTEYEDKWCLDSGASSHMCFEKEKFRNIGESRVDNLKLANNDSTSIEGIGVVEISPNKNITVKLQETLLVPGLRSNLLSVSKITDYGLEVTFRRNEAVVSNPMTGAKIMTAERDKNLYFIKENTEEVATAQESMSTLQKWHYKFGHLNERDLRDLVRHEKVYGVKCKNDEKFPTCEICIKGKQSQMPFPTSNSVSTELLDLIHTDICGPMRCESLGGSKYFATFIDNKSKWCEVYFLKERSEVFDKFLEFKSKVEKQTERKIKVLRSDNGREYCSRKFEDFLKKEGIQHQLSVEYTPQQNGVAERQNRTLLDMARCMLLQSNLPPKFWAEAILTATYLRNRCPSKSLNGETPHKKWTGKVPTAAHFQIFGAKAYMLDKTVKGKFDQKSVECIFVGYSTESKAYRLWDPESQKIRRSRDVKFIDDFEVVDNLQDPINDDILVETDEIELEIQGNPRIATRSDPNENQNGTDSEEDVETEPAIQATRRATGRPKKMYTGKRGRPRKLFHLTHTEQHEEQGPTNVNREEGELVSEEQQFSITEEFAGIVEAGDPITVREALKSTHANEWKEAMRREYFALIQNGTWTLVNRPENKKVVGCKWVLRTKYRSDGNVERRKARLVARGFSQVPGIDFSETFSPVARMSSIRMMMGLAVEYGLKIRQYDFTNAYLNGDLEEEILMEIPEELPSILDSKELHGIRENQVCLLKKALYGLKQSGRQWYQKLDSKLRELLMKPLNADPCVYIHKEGDKLTLIAVYVDDLILASNNTKKVRELTKKLSQCFEMKDLGQLHYCLGIEFEQEEETNTIRMSQRKYILDLLTRFKMEDCKPAITPMNTGLKLSKEMQPKTEEERKQMEKTPFRCLIGSIMYVATSTRPDIAYAVSALSQFNENFGEEHWKAAKRVLRYLKKTKDLTMTFKKRGECLTGFSDADWGASVDDRRSYTGYIFRYAGGAVSWSARKQRTVAMSSAEAEYMALSEAAKEAIYLRSFLAEIVGKINTTNIFCDNQSAGLMAKNAVHHERTKHIDMRYHFVRDAVQRGEINVNYLSTTEMPADILTKGLNGQKHYNSLNSIGLVANDIHCTKIKKCNPYGGVL
ncbi:Retrovirus-related Pol polyprotein from transposon TNT 1-94 [Anthophora retusa]